MCPGSEQKEKVSGILLEPVRPFRVASLFEELRLETERSGKRPRVFLFKFGNPAWITARAAFSGNLFACAGYEIVDHSPFKNVEEGIVFASAGAYEIVVLCSSNEVYLDTAPAVQKALSGKSMVVIAGYPEEDMDALQKAGLEHFIHRDSNVLQTLMRFNKALL